MKKIIILILTLCLFSFSAEAIENKPCKEHSHIQNADIVVKDGSILTIRDCIAIGLKNSPEIKEKAHQLEIARSEVGIEKSVFFPELSVGTNFLQSLNSNRENYDGNFREFPTVDITLKAMIWDFGKSMANIKMKKFLEIAAEYEFEDKVCSTVFNIKKKYYAVLKAKADYEAQVTNLALHKSLIAEMKANKKPQADLLNAERYLQQIEYDLSDIEDRYNDAKEELNNAMFFENAPHYSIYETQTFSYRPLPQNVYKVKAPNLCKIKKDDTIFINPKYTYDEAVNIAYKNSPDLKALVATRDAMEQSLLYVKRKYFPELKANTGYGFIDSTINDTNNKFFVGVGLEASLNAMREKYDIKNATAQLKLADTRIDTFKRNLYHRVRICVYEVKSTYESLPTAQREMEIATKYFKVQHDNYLTDVIDQTVYMESKDAYIDGLKKTALAQYDYNIALIDLEMAMHEHMIDYHDEAEHAADFHAGNENKALENLFINSSKKKNKK